MKKIYDEAGKRIFEYRTIRGYSREEMANKANISSKFLYEIENGKKGFSAEVLYKLAVALKVSSDYILYGKENDVAENRAAEVLSNFNEKQMEHINELLELTYQLSK